MFVPGISPPKKYYRLLKRRGVKKPHITTMRVRKEKMTEEESEHDMNFGLDSLLYFVRLKLLYR